MYKCTHQATAQWFKPACHIDMRVMSVDVECAATGPGHNDRVPCRVACVEWIPDEAEFVLRMDEVIAVHDVKDPLTYITGLTHADIANGISFGEARDVLCSILGDDVCLVGQAIQADIEWMDLQQGVHYCTAIDLARMFRSYHERYKNFVYFSLRKLVYALFDEDIQCKEHDPVIDANYSLRIYAEYVRESKVSDAVEKLQSMTTNRMFPDDMMARNAKTFNGICSFAYDPLRCFCGQPTKRMLR